MRHIIIGDGATGTTAAHYIRSADHSASITIVSDDPNPAYYRAALTNYLLGELQESQLFAVPPDFYIENEIDRILARVASVSRCTASGAGPPPASGMSANSIMAWLLPGTSAR